MRGCRLQRQRILHAADHELALEERLRLDAHLTGCARCRSYHARILALEELVECLPEPPVERLDVARARGNIAAAIDASSATGMEQAAWRNSGDGRPVTARVSGFRWTLAAASAAVGLLFFGLYFFEWSPTIGDGEHQAGGPGPEARVSAAEPSALPTPEIGRVDPGDMQRWLRSALLVAFSEEGGELDVDACMQRFEEAAGADLLRWPLERMAEGLLDAAEPGLARAAARFLGRRGDRISASHLGHALARFLGRPERARPCILALGDLGQPGVGALAVALDDSQSMQLALGQLARSGTLEAAESIGSSLGRLWDRGARESDERVRAHLVALARVGPEAVRVALALADEGRLEQRAALACLGWVRGGGDELVRLLRSESTRARPAGIPLLLDAAASLQPPAALPWIEELATDYQHRGNALACLELWNGSPPLAALMRIASRGSVPGYELMSSFRALADRDGERLSEHARVLLSSGDKLGAGRYLEMLIESAHPSTALALADMAVSDLLTDSDRQWAALAVGDLASESNNGSEDGAAALVRACGSFDYSERRLMASCLISIHRHLGNEGLRAALDDLLGFDVGRIARMLDAAHTEQSTTRVFRIARALGNFLLSRNSLVAASSL